jgi:hypothetical protein
MLLHGLDAVGMSLTHAPDIRNFETQYHAAYPWAAPRQNHPTR